MADNLTEADLDQPSATFAPAAASLDPASIGADAKLGLCLSGGGFRAALFHIGTLAALAERGLLHRVEVLSTVSGGSIVGAYFYLKVKQLLEGRRPNCPTPRPEHYLDIVAEIERDFLHAVQQNLRMRLLLNPYKTARMLLEEEYSRSDRLSELLGSMVYAPIALAADLRLKDIHIAAGGDANTSAIAFNASSRNECKIPILTINATCLNTGHPFHFTGAWLGEPHPRQYAREQNSNVVLPQLRFDGAPRYTGRPPPTDAQLRKMAQITLADAVAASAAVPGLFPAFPIHDLYTNSRGDEIVVELSDGGVFDNIGIDALLEARCTHLLVSDASGQLEDERLLPTDIVSTARRANDVMMERIRGSGYYDLWSRATACPLIPSASESAQAFLTEHCFIRSYAYLHLREQAPNIPALPPLPGPANRPPGIVYRASGVRTDLDAFSDIEADALMYHGYSLALHKLGGARHAAPERRWRFLQIGKLLSSTDGPNTLLKHLRVGKNQFGKPFRLAPAKSWSWLLALLAPALAWAAIWLRQNWDAEFRLVFDFFTPRELWWQLVLLLLAVLPLSATVRNSFKTLRWLRPLKENPASHAAATALSAVVTVLAALSSLAVLIWLRVFNPIFLRAGQYRR